MECPQCHLAVSDAAVRCPACLADIPETPPTVLHPRGELEVLDDKWALEKKLGQGGMGTVYLAHDVDLDRRVAVKMMALSLSDNAELVTRFEREARMMAKLEHPNVVPVYAVGRCDGTPYIVMKYLEGQSLQDYLKARGRLPLGEVLWVTQQACDGLQFIHDRGVVHRDIKPANIFVGPTGHVTLLDLGVAHDTKNVMTRSGVIVGTPRYMAPEQVLGKRVDFHADLYALATVIFELLTGGPVFAHDSDYSIMRAQIDEPPPAPTSRADVPEALNPVLTKALAKDPADRYPSALALAEALAEALGPEVRPVRPRPTQPESSEPRSATPVPAPKRATPRPGSGPAAKDPTPAVGTAPRPPVAPTLAGPSDPPEVPPTRLDAEQTSLVARAGPVPEAQPQRSSTLSTAERSAVRRRAPVAWVGGALGVVALVLTAVWRPWVTEEPGTTATARGLQTPTTAVASATVPAAAERSAEAGATPTVPSAAQATAAAVASPTGPSASQTTGASGTSPTVPSAAQTTATAGASATVPNAAATTAAAGAASTVPNAAQTTAAAAASPTVPNAAQRTATALASPTVPAATQTPAPRTAAALATDPPTATAARADRSGTASATSVAGAPPTATTAAQPPDPPAASRSPARPAPAPTPLASSPYAGAAPTTAGAVPPGDVAERGAHTRAAREGELRLVTTSQGKLTWSYVDVDGLRQGTTPLTVKVSPGPHTLVFHREGYHAVTRQLTLEAAETRKVSVELPRR